MDIDNYDIDIVNIFLFFLLGSYIYQGT